MAVKLVSKLETTNAHLLNIVMNGPVRVVKMQVLIANSLSRLKLNFHAFDAKRSCERDVPMQMMVGKVLILAKHVRKLTSNVLLVLELVLHLH